MEGRYILQGSVPNETLPDYRELFWIQENGISILAYDYEFASWNIGYQSYVGIYSPGIPSQVFYPLMASTWLYYADGNWNESEDIFVGPGRSGNLDLIDLNLVV